MGYAANTLRDFFVGLLVFGVVFAVFWVIWKFIRAHRKKEPWQR